MERAYIFHVNGMHCKACEMAVENKLKDVPYIVRVKASLHKHTLEVAGLFGDMTPEEAAHSLSRFIESHGYTLSVARQSKKINLGDFKVAAPLALAFVLLFLLLQKVGIVSLVKANDLSLGTAFVIGVVASLSTCMAVVGGLVLSMSATFAKEGDKVRPQLMFHAGRIIAFFVLGGVIGAIGAAFTLNVGATFILSLIIGLVMLILGINLLDVFPWAKRLQPSMPRFISRHVHGASKLNYTLTPILVGVATFFLPCGFTQSMQLYTLTTGSFLGGGLTMFAFALGTLPVLALISFSSFSIQSSGKKSIFFKTAGLVVIIFALFNLYNSFAVMGLLPPAFNF